MDTESTPLTSENTTPSTDNELALLSEDELMSRYNNSDEESPEFTAAKDELIRRGYTFEAADAQPEEEDDENLNILRNSTLKMPYGKTGTLVWEWLYTGLAIVGAAYFLITLSNNDVKLSTRLIVTTALVVLFAISLGVMVGAVRRMANRRVSNNERLLLGPSFILGSLWFLSALGAMYYAIDMFVDVAKYSFKYALMSAVLPLAGVLICIAFAVFFFVLFRESSN
jgi:hypothetical protein